MIRNSVGPNEIRELTLEFTDATGMLFMIFAGEPGRLLLRNVAINGSSLVEAYGVYAYGDARVDLEGVKILAFGAHGVAAYARDTATVKISGGRYEGTAEGVRAFSGCTDCAPVLRVANAQVVGGGSGATCVNTHDADYLALDTACN